MENNLYTQETMDREIHVVVKELGPMTRTFCLFDLAHEYAEQESTSFHVAYWAIMNSGMGGNPLIRIGSKLVLPPFEIDELPEAVYPRLCVV